MTTRRTIWSLTSMFRIRLTFFCHQIFYQRIINHLIKENYTICNKQDPWNFNPNIIRIVVWGRTSLCSPGWHGTCHVNQICHRLTCICVSSTGSKAQPVIKTLKNNLKIKETLRCKTVVWIRIVMLLPLVPCHCTERARSGFKASSFRLYWCKMRLRLTKYIET